MHRGGRGGRGRFGHPTTPQRGAAADAAKQLKCTVCHAAFGTRPELQTHLIAGHLNQAEDECIELGDEDEQPKEHEQDGEEGGDRENEKENDEQPAGGHAAATKRGRRKAKVACKYCKSADYYGPLDAHVSIKHLGHRTVPSGVVFECPKCAFRSRDPQQRDAHIAAEHTDVDPEAMSGTYSAATLFHCPECAKADRRYALLMKHCAIEHPNATFIHHRIGGTFLADYEQHYGYRPMLAAKRSGPAVIQSTIPPSHMKACRVCKLKVVKHRMLEHVRLLHAGRLGRRAMVFLCTHCDFRSTRIQERDEHVRSVHPAVDPAAPLIVDGVDKDFHCAFCPESFDSHRLVDQHFDEAHKAELEAEAERLAKQRIRELQLGVESPTEDEEEAMPPAVPEAPVVQQPLAVEEPPVVVPATVDEPPLRPIKTEPGVEVESKAERKAKRKAAKEAAKAAAELKKPKVEVKQELQDEGGQMEAEAPALAVQPRHRLFSGGLTQTAAEETGVEVTNVFHPFTTPAARLQSMLTLMGELLRRPRVIYYDYQLLSKKYGTLPIDLWLTAGECQALFVRHSAEEIAEIPELGRPLVTSSMLRFEAPRKCDRESFVLAFAKPEAEEMAAALLIEASRHTTFAELTADLIPSLKADSVLIVASDVDKKTARDNRLTESGNGTVFKIV
ncbi:hypothetical protein M3Y99_00752800 [Aphelenchoides fujianensis]|nr:hypothetical protein M3Y99_00752800 [Aphelenchoides fujianensis]